MPRGRVPAPFLGQRSPSSARRSPSLSPEVVVQPAYRVHTRWNFSAGMVLQPVRFSGDHLVCQEALLVLQAPPVPVELAGRGRFRG